MSGNIVCIISASGNALTYICSTLFLGFFSDKITLSSIVEKLYLEGMHVQVLLEFQPELRNYAADEL